MEDDTPLDVDNSAQNWLAPPPKEDGERETKRLRTANHEQAKKRNARMFGVLAGTLKQAKKEAQTTTEAVRMLCFLPCEGVS